MAVKKNKEKEEVSEEVVELTEEELEMIAGGEKDNGLQTYEASVIDILGNEAIRQNKP